MNNQNIKMFKDQINEDIELIQEQWEYADFHLSSKAYAFNYWVLSRIYNVDEAIIPEFITEYNDKGIDCYVHFEENSELYIIQNKFYDDSDAVTRNDVADFFTDTIIPIKKESI